MSEAICDHIAHIGCYIGESGWGHAPLEILNRIWLYLGHRFICAVS